MSTESSNRRQSYRLQTSFHVETVMVPSGQPVQTSQIRDISRFGIGLISLERVDVGTRIEIRIPAIAPDFALTAEVIWCGPDYDGNFELGCRLVGDSSPLGDATYDQIQDIETFRHTAQDISGRSMSSEEAAREWRRKFTERLAG